LVLGLDEAIQIETHVRQLCDGEQGDFPDLLPVTPVLHAGEEEVDVHLLHQVNLEEQHLLLGLDRGHLASAFLLLGGLLLKIRVLLVIRLI